jgi:Flp pilus assembly protein TadG
MKQYKQSGQSVVEFALILPLLVLFLVAILEWGLVLYDKAIITNAAREGARAGIVATPGTARSAASVKNLAETAANLYLSNNLVTFGADTPSVTESLTGLSSINDTVTVTVTYNYNWMALPNFLAVISPVPLSSKSTMRFE